MKLVAMFLIVLTCAVGCRSVPKEQPPKLAAMSEAEAMALINARTAALQTVQGSADVTLTGRDGKSVTLDAAIVLAPPSRLRLRTWKLGQGVFDVMLDGDEAWLWIGREEASGMSRLTRSTLQDVVQVIFAQITTLKRNPGRELGGEAFVSRGGAESGPLRVYDPKTLTLSRVLYGQSGGQRAKAEIRFDEYRVINDQVWPTRVNIVSEAATIDIRFKDVTINEELPPKALQPAPRAKRLP